MDNKKAAQKILDSVSKKLNIKKANLKGWQKEHPHQCAQLMLLEVGRKIIPCKKRQLTRLFGFTDHYVFTLNGNCVECFQDAAWIENMEQISIDVSFYYQSEYENLTEMQLVVKSVSSQFGYSMQVLLDTNFTAHGNAIVKNTVLYLWQELLDMDTLEIAKFQNFKTSSKGVGSKIFKAYMKGKTDANYKLDLFRVCDRYQQLRTGLIAA